MADPKSIIKSAGKSAVASGDISSASYAAEAAAKESLKGNKAVGKLRKADALFARVRGGTGAVKSMASSKVKSIVGRNVPHKGRELLALKRKALGTGAGLLGVGLAGKAFAKVQALGKKAGVQAGDEDPYAGMSEEERMEAMAKDEAARAQAAQQEAAQAQDQVAEEEGYDPDGELQGAFDDKIADKKGELEGQLAAEGEEGAEGEEVAAAEEKDPEIDESLTVLRTERPDGSLKSAIEQENGKLSGASEEYDENGNVTMQAFYLDGKLQGPMTHYDAEGNVTQVIEFEDGAAEGKCTKFDDQGRRIQDATFKGGKLSGECLFYREGRLVMKMRYLNGKAMGPGTIYNDQENVMMEANYVDGKLSGPARFYDKAGQLTRECSYLENKLHGQLTDYYPKDRKSVV